MDDAVPAIESCPFSKEDARRVRVYCGTEFCETLLPSPTALVDACRRSVEDFGGFTFVTPPVGEKALARLEGLFAALAEEETPVEVSVNDWGVLRSLRPFAERLRPVLGRLMNKMLRDPRVTPLFDEASLTPEALRVTRQSAMTSTAYAAMLRAFGVERVELDNVHQGIDIDFAALALRPSLHVPFSCVTTGPACFFAGVHQPKDAKFTQDTACRLECRELVGTMADPAGGAGGALLARGNTVFSLQDNALVGRAMAWAEERAARLVLHDQPFGMLAWGTEDVALARRWIEARHE